jgi:DnaK suppressor protein
MTPLSDRQRDELKERLTNRRQVLRAEVQRELANSDDPRVAGFMNQLAATEDWVLADILGDLDIAMVTRDVAELSEVEAALARIADGSYGTCSDCSEPIGWPRLNAQPTADRCIACQEKLEVRSGRPGHSSL